MTCYEFLSHLKSVSLSVPTINTFIEDVDMVSAYQNLKYGAIAIEQGSMTIEDNGWMTWNGSIYYIDQIIDKPSSNPNERKEDNHLKIQSFGVTVLHTILKNLVNVRVDDVTYNVFTARFLDYCAGVQANVTVKFPLTYCWDTIGE